MSASDSRQSEFSFSIDRPEFKRTLALFALIGTGFGLTAVFTLLYFGGGSTGTGFFSGIIVFVILFIAILSGPLIAATVGTRQEGRMDAPRDTILTTSFLSNATGYVLMVLLVVLFIALGFGMMASGGDGSTVGGEPTPTTGGDTDGGSAPFDIGSLIIPILGFAIPTGLTGSGGAYIARRYDTTPISTVTGGHTTAEGDSSSRSTANRTPEVGLGASDTGDKIRNAVARVSYGLALLSGLVASLVVMFLVILVAYIDPNIPQASESFFGMGLFSLDITGFGVDATPLGLFRIVTWILLLAHGVTVQGLSFELVQMSLLQIIPGLVLIAAGFVLTRRRPVVHWLDGMISGASLTVGYVIAILVFAFLSQATFDATATFRAETVAVDIVGAVLKAGLLYPVVFGGIGGLIAAVAQER